MQRGYRPLVSSANPATMIRCWSEFLRQRAKENLCADCASPMQSATFQSVVELTNRVRHHSHVWEFKRVSIEVPSEESILISVERLYYEI